MAGSVMLLSAAVLNQNACSLVALLSSLNRTAEPPTLHNGSRAEARQEIDKDDLASDGRRWRDCRG
jgi:hypothetical protein